MAKKKVTEVKELPKNGLFDSVAKKFEGTSVLADDENAEIEDWIPTGCYIFNAAISGSIFKGIPAGRITVLTGDPQTGKTYLACSIAREAQKKGYKIVYLDSEGAVDREFMKRLGVDPNMVMKLDVNTISETTAKIIHMLDVLDAQQAEYGQHEKVMFVLDSQGQLTSDKEKDDLANETGKRDMTPQRELKALYRVITPRLMKLGCPMVVTNHVYNVIGAYVPTKEMSGGQGLKYAASSIVTLSQKKLETKTNDAAAAQTAGAETLVKKGVLVRCKLDKSRFTIPRIVEFQIPFFSAPLPHLGLQSWLNWENSGIAPGKLLTEKEYTKLSDSEKKNCDGFVHNGENLYYQTSAQPRNIVVKELGIAVPIKEAFEDGKIFTPDILARIDEQVIKPLFELPKHMDGAKSADEVIEMLSFGDSAEINDRME